MNMIEVVKRNRHWWIQAGLQFGYPLCCINAFCNMAHVGGSVRKLNGTGFVPCKVCNQTKTEAFMRDEIQKARDPSIPPFPLGTLK